MGFDDINKSLKAVQAILISMNMTSDNCLETDENASAELLMEAQIIKQSCEVMITALEPSVDMEYREEELADAVVRFL